jgi:2-keto-4-pentenoate hydratase/2-oxohepta-3-ene-1,7-dioic acid hydratase in catechol pathway
MPVKGIKPRSGPKGRVRLCTFVSPREKRTAWKLGIAEGDRILEVPNIGGMLSFLTAGGGLKTLKKGRDHRMAKVKLLAPIPRPGKIVAAIVNTRAMLGGDAKLDRPRLDMKAPSTVIGPGEIIRAPDSGIRPEVELAAIIGKRISAASPAQAKKAIFGYTILNDVTAPRDSRDDAYEAHRRDPKTGEIAKRIMRGPLFRSKNHDTFCPMGPWVVSGDELADVSDLRMTAKFNGTKVQEGSTADYLFQPEEIASYVSGFLTLEPGDVISCGSVGWTGVVGSADPSEFILPSRNGTLELTVNGIGVLSNPVREMGSGGAA